jgi:hypothetical protein
MSSKVELFTLNSIILPLRSETLHQQEQLLSAKILYKAMRLADIKFLMASNNFQVICRIIRCKERCWDLKIKNR